jgi:carbonic anhydrase
VKGAIDDVEMGNLTGLLARTKPAISATTFDGEKSSKNAATSMPWPGRMSW